MLDDPPSSGVVSHPHPASILPIPGPNLQEEESGTGEMASAASPPQEVMEWSGYPHHHQRQQALSGKLQPVLAAKGGGGDDLISLKIKKDGSKEEQEDTTERVAKPPTKQDDKKEEEDDEEEGDHEANVERVMECVQCKWTGKLPTPNPSNQTIQLNVGGKKFRTYVDTITKNGPTTMLGAMLLTLRSQIKEEYFIDRDPQLFNCILQWYRTGSLYLPPGVCKEVILEEMDFYGIPRSELKIPATVKVFCPCVKRHWKCAKCETPVTWHKELIAKTFRCSSGKAYLFSRVKNVKIGEPYAQAMITGNHTVCDLRCLKCDTYLGWTYKAVENAENKYKEGKSCLEKKAIVKENIQCQEPSLE